MEMLGSIVVVNQRLPVIRCLSYIRWFTITVVFRIQKCALNTPGYCEHASFLLVTGQPPKKPSLSHHFPLYAFCFVFLLYSSSYPWHQILFKLPRRHGEQETKAELCNFSWGRRGCTNLLSHNTYLKCIPFIWRCGSSTFPHCNIQRIRYFCCLFSSFSAILSFEDIVFLSQIVFIYQDNWRNWLLIVHNLRSIV